MIKRIIALLLFCIVLNSPLDAQTNASREDLQKQEQSLRKELDELNRLLEQTKKNKKSSLGQLAVIRSKIAKREALVNGISQNSLEIVGTTVHSAYGIVSALLFLPIFDTIRVFTLRLCNKQHPFKGDSNHMHHRLIKLGLTHSQIAGTFVVTTLALTLCSILLHNFNPAIQVLILLGIVLLLNLITYYALKRQQNVKSQIQN